MSTIVLALLAGLCGFGCEEEPDGLTQRPDLPPFDSGAVTDSMYSDGGTWPPTDDANVIPPVPCPHYAELPRSLQDIAIRSMQAWQTQWGDTQDTVGDCIPRLLVLEQDVSWSSGNVPGEFHRRPLPQEQRTHVVAGAVLIGRQGPIVAEADLHAQGHNGVPDALLHVARNENEHLLSFEVEPYSGDNEWSVPMVVSIDPPGSGFNGKTVVVHPHIPVDHAWQGSVVWMLLMYDGRALLVTSVIAFINSDTIDLEPSAFQPVYTVITFDDNWDASGDHVQYWVLNALPLGAYVGDIMRLFGLSEVNAQRDVNARAGEPHTHYSAGTLLISE